MKIDLKQAILRIKDGSTNQIEVKLGSGNLTFSEKKERKYTKNYGALHTVRNENEEALEVSFDFVWEWLRAASRAAPNIPENRVITLSDFNATVDGEYRYVSGTGNNIRYESDSGTKVLRPLASPAGFVGTSATPNMYSMGANIFGVYPYDGTLFAWNIATLPSYTPLVAGFISMILVKNVDTAPYTGVTPTILESLKQQGAAAEWVSVGATCEPYCVDLEIEYDPQCGGVEKETIVLPKFRYESLDHDSGAGSIACSGKCLSTDAVVTRG